MKRSIIKPILIGILIGTAAFFAPFLLLKGLCFLLIIGFIFKIFWWKSRGWHGGGGKMSYSMLLADKIRGMSEEEYAEFKNSYANNSCGYRGGCGCGCGCGSGRCTCNDDCCSDGTSDKNKAGAKDAGTEK